MPKELSNLRGIFRHSVYLLKDKFAYFWIMALYNERVNWKFEQGNMNIWTMLTGTKMNI